MLYNTLTSNLRSILQNINLDGCYLKGLKYQKIKSNISKKKNPFSTFVVPKTWKNLIWSLKFHLFHI